MVNRADLKGYRRIQNNNGDEPAPNEIRVSSERSFKPYVSFALKQLNGEDRPALRTIKLSGMGKTIPIVILACEKIKQEMKNKLHQNTRIWTKTFEEQYVCEGKEDVFIERFVSMISIELSLDKFDTRASGYQAPQSIINVESEEDTAFRKEKQSNYNPRSYNRHRFSQKPKHDDKMDNKELVQIEKNEGQKNIVENRSQHERGRGHRRGGYGRGRGRGGYGRGRGRGGYGRGRGRNFQ